MQIFAVAKESLVLIRISMIPGIVVLFLYVTSKHGSSGNKLKWKQRSFHIQITYFFLYGEWTRVSRKFSWRFLKRCFYLLREGVLLFSQIFWNKFYPRWFKKKLSLLVITALIQYSDKFLLYTCIYTDEEQLSAHFY